MVAELTADAFHPYETLAKSVLPHACEGDDGSHDLAHIHRVFRNAMRIHGQEGGDGEVVAAAVLLHDCVAVEKSSPLRKQASRLAAEKAAGVLGDLGWEASRIAQVAHAILTHSFSANLEPESIEARILQDADRLDAIGAIGIARCFYTAGRMGSALYHAGDPEAMNRELNDRDYAIDHFPAKLLMLASGFKTKAGQALANARQERLDRFLSDFHDEI